MLYHRVHYLSRMVTLKVDSLAKSYASDPVFRNLSFHFSGGIIGIAGPNGSGKSTLLRCISGLTLPSSGTVQWDIDGSDYSNTTVAKALGYAAPYVQLYEELTAFENLKFIRDLRSSQTCESLAELIKTYDISGFADSLFGELSSGQQQRVKLAASSIHRPKILCLDEPGTNLDDAGQEIIKQMIQSCADSGGMVLLASNQIRELDLCDEVLNVAESKKTV